MVEIANRKSTIFSMKKAVLHPESNSRKRILDYNLNMAFIARWGHPQHAEECRGNGGTCGVLANEPTAPHQTPNRFTIIAACSFSMRCAR